MMNWICLIFGHRWHRYGFPARSEDIEKDDAQMFMCLRCIAMPIVGHNGALPRFIKPIHKEKPTKIRKAV